MKNCSLISLFCRPEEAFETFCCGESVGLGIGRLEFKTGFPITWVENCCSASVALLELLCVLKGIVVGKSSSMDSAGPTWWRCHCL